MLVKPSKNITVIETEETYPGCPDFHAIAKSQGFLMMRSDSQLIMIAALGLEARYFSADLENEAHHVLPESLYHVIWYLPV